MRESGLERENAAGEHEFKENHDENEKGDHLRLHRYLVKLLGMIMTMTELWNGEIVSGVSVCVQW